MTPAATFAQNPMGGFTIPDARQRRVIIESETPSSLATSAPGRNSGTVDITPTLRRKFLPVLLHPVRSTLLILLTFREPSRMIEVPQDQERRITITDTTKIAVNAYVVNP